MKNLKLIAKLVRCATHWRKVLFLSIAPLFFSTACAPAEDLLEPPYEAVWWHNLHVQATPIRDKNKALFAIRVALTNRSLKDHAIFEREGLQPQAFFLNFGPPTFGALPSYVPLRTIEHEMTPIDSSPRIKPIAVEIAPSQNLSFCLKLEDYILPNQTLAPETKQRMILSLMGALAWRRATGKVTPYYREKDADHKVIPAYHPPKFDFGIQKIMIHKNLTCEDAGK